MKLSKRISAYIIVFILVSLIFLFIITTGKSPLTGNAIINFSKNDGNNSITGNAINIPNNQNNNQQNIPNNNQNIPIQNSNSNNGNSNNDQNQLLNFPTNNNSQLNNNQTNSSNNQSRSGGGGGRRRGGGGNQNPPSDENPNPNNGNSSNSTNPENSSNIQNPSNKKFKFKNLPNRFNFRRNGFKINESDSFEGKLRFTIEKETSPISEFDVDFSNDLDLSGVVADVNISEGKAFMHTQNKIFDNITLFIPRLPGMNGVVICSNASSFEEVHVGCSSNPFITREYILEIGNENLSISDDGLFFLVRGITGTGGNGVNLTSIINETSIPDMAGNHSAYAGNLTELRITAFSVTQSWQGYYGNVSGTIHLADSTDNVMYNWSLISPQGQVYASTNSTIFWANMQCFNFTSSGNYSGSETPGGTSQYGTNLTQIETMFNISSDDVDGVNETFFLYGSGHDQFFTAHNQFDMGECRNTRIFSDIGNGEDNKFEEVLLYEPNTTSIVFTAIIDENLLGFDNASHDFEMLVLENGHGNDTSTTTYYFFSELQ